MGREEVHRLPMKLTLKRYQTDPQTNSLFGKLFIDDIYQCETLENLKLSIKPGVYLVAFHQSPRFNRLLPILHCPPREYILIHPANWSHELEGCIAVGTARSQDALSNSRFAMNQLMAKIQEQDALSIEVCAIPS